LALGIVLASVAVLATAAAVHAQQKAKKRTDPTKRKIERTTRAVVARSDSARGPDNPKVPPGKVAWHPSVAAASAAAKKSGKPVLLFHMMGRLDNKFC
jgi:hypothetical protein